MENQEKMKKERNGKYCRKYQMYCQFREKTFASKIEIRLFIRQKREVQNYQVYFFQLMFVVILLLINFDFAGFFLANN